MNDPENKLGATTAPTRNNSNSASKTSEGSQYTQPDDLHDLFTTPADFDGNDEEDPLAQLRNDPNYAALIRDLEYIAKEARSLFQSAEESPSDDLWTKIQSQLPPKPDAD